MSSSRQPQFILRNCNIFIDRVSQIGQASEMAIPVPAEKTEEIRNAGMVLPIEVTMGYEKLEASAKFTSFDPAILSLFGLKIGTDKEFMITGALVDEDGTTRPVVAYLTGRIIKQDGGKWKSGDKAETDYSIVAKYYKLEIDGKPILEFTPFEVSVNGVSQTDKIRQALLV